MTTPTREQVVMMTRTAFSMQYCALPVPEYQIETLASMIRSDLEATIAEQAAELESLRIVIEMKNRDMEFLAMALDPDDYIGEVKMIDFLKDCIAIAAAPKEK